MDAQQCSFMLLPDFTFAPDQDIQLGTLLPLSSKTKLPEPDLPLNADDRLDPPQHHVKYHTEHRWKFSNSTQSCWSAGIEADVPVFLPAGGGVGYGSEHNESLAIECERLETHRFVPSSTYIAQALKTDFVRDYCRKRWRPSVYLVTGLKIAEKAAVQSSASRSHDENLKAKIDATSFGVALNAGPTTKASKTAAGDNARYIEGRFILAYQLKRLRLSGKGALKSMEAFNKFALFDDEASIGEEADLGAWDIEDVQPDTAHDA